MEELTKALLYRGWIKRDDLSKILGMSERKMRDKIAKYNERFYNDESELFIAHSCKGYMLTTDAKIIRSSVEDDYKRAMKLLKRSSRTIKALSQKNQITLMPEEATIYEVICATSN